MLKKLAPNVHAHRYDIALVNFAAEAIITGNPNIDLYKPSLISNMD